MRAFSLPLAERPERYSPRVCLLIITAPSAAAWGGIAALAMVLL